MPQIFIAHSSKDKLLIDRIAEKLQAIGFNPYRAEYESPSPLSVQEKLSREISKSQAVFVILTRTVTRSKNTSLIIQWEITTAQDKKKPVYVFVEKRVKVPLMIKLTQDYGTFDPVSEESLVEMLGKMANIGKQLKTQEEQNRALMVKGFGEFAKSIFAVLQSQRQMDDVLTEGSLNQPKLAVEIKIGFIEQGRQQSEPVVYLQAGNRGSVPVIVPSLSSLQIVLPDHKFLIPHPDTWDTDKDFPFELGPGRGLSIWRDMQGFVNGMKKNGYSGKLNLKPICKDEAGRVFEGSDFMLNVDDWSNYKPRALNDADAV
jgi:hypothetical protein